MKTLLQKSTKPFLVFILIVLVFSIPVYFLVVDYIWRNELDEHNRIVKENTVHQLNKLQLNDDEFEKHIGIFNNSQSGVKIVQVSKTDNLKDSTYSIYRQKEFTNKKTEDRFVGLSSIVYIKNKPFRLSTEINIEESYETISVIALVTSLFFFIIIAGLIIINRKLSKELWQPFQDTLQKLKLFHLNSQKQIDFQKTDTIEFAELNATLDKLLHHNIATYRSQKEFTENASHELQTPLAVLKNKLDILLQSNDLTERQYHIAEEMNKALIRSSRINKNLLLLAKIENSQFDNSELIGFDMLVAQSMDGLEEHFNEKNIHIGSSIQPDVEVKGNSSLTEVLINNLIINAIRHTSPGGAIRVALSKSGFEVRNSGGQALDTDLLFKRFSRMSADNSGSGLGLSIVQEICRLHSWQVTYGFENGEHIFSVTF